MTQRLTYKKTWIYEIIKLIDWLLVDEWVIPLKFRILNIIFFNCKNNYLKQKNSYIENNCTVVITV